MYSLFKVIILASIILDIYRCGFNEEDKIVSNQ